MGDSQTTASSDDDRTHVRALANVSASEAYALYQKGALRGTDSWHNTPENGPLGTPRRSYDPRCRTRRDTYVQAAGGGSCRRLSRRG
jgi:hypothetical protein